ncbi:MAG: integrase family protein, partial [Actinomycetota bacterium]|nr:integrase family protein [Actinomycetota bacterium]
MPAIKVTSEGRLRITRAVIESAWRRRKPGHRLVIRDAECRGLALVVNPTGMTWVYSYRPRGTDPTSGRRWPNKTVTIGNPATHGPDHARTEANRIKGELKIGTDPAAARQARVREEASRRARTGNALLEQYQRAVASRPSMRGSGPVTPRYIREEMNHVRMALQAIDGEERPVADVTVDDVRRLLAAVRSQQATARHRYGSLSRFFEWCVESGYRPDNPCAQIARSRRPKPVVSRPHYLTPAELARLWRAADHLLPVHRDLVRFLIAVPCRRGEAIAMT